jgi:DNA-binding MarR family transcriptional regulator
MLHFIGTRPGISQTALSLAVHLDKTTLTPALSDMERQGLIVREKDPEDLRARRLSLTPKGCDALVRLSVVAAEHDARIDRILGARDRDELLRLLRTLIAGLNVSEMD